MFLGAVESWLDFCGVFFFLRGGIYTEGREVGCLCFFDIFSLHSFSKLEFDERGGFGGEMYLQHLS